jgi:hypothetical protein
LENELKIILLAELKITTPNLGNDFMYERCVAKYLSAMLPAISQAIALNYKNTALKAGEFALAQTKLRKELRRIGTAPQKYIADVMKSHATTSLIIEIKKGFNYANGSNMLSLVKLNPIYKDLIVDELLNLRMEKNLKLPDENERASNYTVNVDPASLASYIRKTISSIKTTTKGEAYKDKLLRNLMAAKQLQTMIHDADETNATPYINERWEKADSGRIYGHGYSLQRMPKEVRNATLGYCYKYDFKASAFALMAGLAHAINSEIKIGAVLDYVKNRTKIRERIAKELDIDESVVKTVFSAIGFGAELKNNQFNAIRGAFAKVARMKHDTTIRLEKDIYNNLGADEFKRLVNNSTFGEIYEALQVINQTILDYYKTNELVICDRTYSNIDVKTSKKRNDKQKLAWIYQAMEFTAMEKFSDIVFDMTQQETLLTTHDCIYYKNRLSLNVRHDATNFLNQTFPYLRFEEEEIVPIMEDELFNARFADAEQFEQEHLQRIKEQELLARNYSSKYIQ